ncbi:MAG: DUF4886 domain-containing protein [Halieaceae bacterium]|nr:DUF4886 domain-containing protein [Halieaceae bacterium]
MVRSLAVMALLAPLPALAQEAPAVTSLDMETPTQILFVGNSYLYYGDSVHNHVVRMARAAHPDERFTYKSATIGGAYLDHHDLDAHLEPGKLGLDDPFDVVILQGHSTAMTTEAKVARFNVALTEFDAAIRATGAHTALFMTMAYTEDHRNYDPEMFSKVDAGYTAAGNRVGALVIPVGLAFEMAYERRPGIVLHKSFDGSHPSLLGTYLIAATMYAALYEPSAVGNPYDYFGAIPADDLAFLQQVAEDAVAAYYGR